MPDLGCLDADRKEKWLILNIFHHLSRDQALQILHTSSPTQTPHIDRRWEGADESMQDRWVLAPAVLPTRAQGPYVELAALGSAISNAMYAVEEYLCYLGCFLFPFERNIFISFFDCRTIFLYQERPPLTVSHCSLVIPSVR